MTAPEKRAPDSRSRSSYLQAACLGSLLLLAGAPRFVAPRPTLERWLGHTSAEQQSSYAHTAFELRQTTATSRHLMESEAKSYYNLSGNAFPEKLDIDDESEKDVQRHMLTAVKPYSALRDTKDGKVRIFFDAQLWIAEALKTCAFDNGAEGKERVEVQSTGSLVALSGGMPFIGYMLELDDPGPSFNQAVMLFSGWEPATKVYRIQITEIEYMQKGVGMCTAPLFSERQAVPNWMNDALQAGISELYVYFTDIPDKSFHNRLFGVHMGVGLNEFAPEPHSAVQYFYYEAPAGSSYFSQTTFLNECLYRNRQSHSFLVFADVDEYLSIKQQTPPGMPSSQVLEMLLQSLFPNDTASMVVDVIPYPDICQDAFKGGFQLPANASVAMNSHNFEVDAPLYKATKYVAVPSRVELAWVHTITKPVSGYQPQFLGPTDSLFIKHVRYTPRGALHLCKATQKDSNEAAFQKRIANNPSMMANA